MNGYRVNFLSFYLFNLLIVSLLERTYFVQRIHLDRVFHFVFYLGTYFYSGWLKISKYIWELICKVFQQGLKLLGVNGLQMNKIYWVLNHVKD